MLKLGILLLLFLIQMVYGSEVHSTLRLVTRLFHIDSVQAPFYSSNDDLAEIDLYGSLGHVFLHSSQHFGTVSAPVYPLPRSGFLVHLKVGQHRADQYLYLDTGSSLLWIHCRPNSLNAKNPVYDSKESSTYQAEDCRTSEFCDAYDITCDHFQRCQYIRSYGDGIKSKGHLARETFVFGSTGSSLFSTNDILHDIVFGCSNATSLLSDGIFGLGNNTHSLLAQTSSSRFSYCLGDINDRDYDYNILIIGNPLKKRLTNEIPLIDDGKYFIDMTAIQIGRAFLDIETDTLKRNIYEHTGGMAVDTGSTFSYFPETIYYPFALAIRKIIDDLSLDRHYYIDPDMLCYNGRFRKDLVEFPTVRFWFGEISYMEFRTGHLFQQRRDETFCLAFKTDKKFDYGIMGVLLQQGYYISYNLQASTFSFETMDCSAFDNDIHDEL